MLCFLLHISGTGTYPEPEFESYLRALISMGFETESTLRIKGYVIQYVYYIGMLPFKWDWTRGEIVQITKKSDIFRFRLTISLMLLLKGTILCTFIHRFFSGLVDLRVAKGTNDLILSHLFGFLGMLDLHLLLKMSDLHRTFNLFCRYYKFIRKCKILIP